MLQFIFNRGKRIQTSTPTPLGYGPGGYTIRRYIYRWIQIIAIFSSHFNIAHFSFSLLHQYSMICKYFFRFNHLLCLAYNANSDVISVEMHVYHSFNRRSRFALQIKNTLRFVMKHHIELIIYSGSIVSEIFLSENNLCLNLKNHGILNGPVNARGFWMYSRWQITLPATQLATS